MPILSNYIYRNHDADDDHTGAKQHPQAQPFFDDMARLLAVAVQQECHREEAHGARHDRKDDEQRKIVAGEARGNGHQFVRDRGESLEEDNQGPPTRILLAEYLNLATEAVDMDQPAADRVIEQRANRIADD